MAAYEAIVFFFSFEIKSFFLVNQKVLIANYIPASCCFGSHSF